MTTPRDIAIEVLVEALHDAECLHIGEGGPRCTEVAPELLANPRLASLLLTGAAVEMLPDNWLDDILLEYVNLTFSGERAIECRDRIRAAIAKALEAKP